MTFLYVLVPQSHTYGSAALAQLLSCCFSLNTTACIQYICIYIYTYTHVHIYIYIHMSKQSIPVHMAQTVHTIHTCTYCTYQVHTYCTYCTCRRSCDLVACVVCDALDDSNFAHIAYLLAHDVLMLRRSCGGAPIG